jgi:pimeloyl-ACP methyl ester carboxylesterase
VGYDRAVPETANRVVRIHFEVQGDGPTVILHTGGGGDLEMWRLAGYDAGLGGFRTVLMDHRGHGRSDRPTDPAEHHIDRYVEDVVAVADAAGVERFAFFGYSGGAEIGYHLAAKHPDRVAALVGLGAVGAPTDPATWQLERAEDIRSGGIDVLVRGLLEEEPGISSWFLDQMRSTDPEMLALQLEGSAEASPWDKFVRIAAPTLIVVGELEEGPGDTAARNARTAADRIPGGRAEVLPGLGHCVAFERSDLVLAHVRPFLASVDLG